MNLQLRDATISYERHGAGRPLLCLHGGMGIDSTSLRVPGIVGLSRHDLDVVLYDQRGHGLSSGGDREENFTHERWAQDAADIAQQLGWARFAMLGHSYGGFIALEHAARWPETLTHLVLVATSAGPLRVAPARFESDDELRDYYRREWSLMFTGEDKHWELLKSLRFSSAPFNAAFNRELPRYDLRKKIPGLHMPALLIVGSRDPYLPHMQWLAAEMPRARLHVIQGAGHFPFVEAEQEFVATVATFLQRTN